MKDEPTGILVQQQQEPTVTDIIELPPFGQTFGQLTRFGSAWLDLSKITAIDFDPSDGCGCEIQLGEMNDLWHLSPADGAALQTYLNTQALSRSTEIRELEQLASR